MHAFVNELERPIGTYLYGRRMYETMAVWEDPGDGLPPVARTSPAIWQAADKVVYSRTLDDVSSARTRLERELDPDAVRRLKESAARDMSIGGPTLAGSGARGRPGRRARTCSWCRSSSEAASARCRTTCGSCSSCVDERRFAGGVVFLRYLVTRSAA